MKVYFLLILTILTTIIFASSSPEVYKGLKRSKRFISLKMDNSMNLKEFKYKMKELEIKDIEDIKQINDKIFIIKFKSEIKEDIFKNYHILPNYTLDDNKWPSIADNQMIISFKKDIKIDKENFMKFHNYGVLHKFIHNKNTYLVKTDKNIFAELEKLDKTGYFKYTQVDFYTHHVLHFAPNDPLYSKQWHLKTSPGVSAEAAWNITKGSAAVKISIIDNGIDLNHEDLNIVKHKDFTRSVEDFTDKGDHGTSCAGVAAGKGNNSIGTTGICMNCSIFAAKIIHSSNYSLESADARAINWSTNAGADILSNSWGYGQDFNLATYNPALYNSIHYAATEGRNGKGAIVIFASGNEYRRFSDDSLPGHPDIITVGASDDRGYRSEYSNFGNKLFVVAPSNGGYKGITTADITGAKGYDPGNYTDTFGGTSSATPLVSGLVGLILSKDSSLTFSQVKEILKNTSDKIPVKEDLYLEQSSKCKILTGANYGSNGHSICNGYGRINAKRALEHVRDNMNNSACTPNLEGEICDNSIDDDCDGKTDSNDMDCKEDDQCIGYSCPDNSHCATEGVNQTASCFCNEGYRVNDQQTACVEITCQDLECSNNSSCQKINGINQCVCNEGYKYDQMARTCKSSLCENVTCDTWQKCNSHNGKCEAKSGFCDFDYECGSAFKCNTSSHLCYNPCDEITCSGHGTCINDNGNLYCSCDSGYKAQDLECIEGGGCAGITCSGHGKCINDNGNLYCNCSLGYQSQGLSCISNESCAGITCSGHGICGKDNYGLFCDCEAGYYEDSLECKLENNSSSNTSSSCDYSNDNKFFAFIFIAFLFILLIKRKYNIIKVKG